MTHRLWAWLLERRRLGSWLWSVVHCADDWWLTLPRGHCETKERAEKDGAQDLTITYACARMLYGRGRCVIGTLSVVDRVRVLAVTTHTEEMPWCSLVAIEVELHFKGMWCLVWRTVITTAGESCNETRCGSRVRRPRPVAFTGEDRTQAS